MTDGSSATAATVRAGTGLNPALEAAPARVLPVTLDDAPPPWPALSLTVPPEVSQHVTDLVEWRYGGHSTLLRGRLARDGAEVVVKCHRRRDSNEDAVWEVLTGLTSDFHVAIYDLRAHEHRWWEVMEYCPYGTVGDLIARHPAGLPADQLRTIAMQMADALGDLHARGVVHVDVTSANVLVRCLSPLTVVLGDLGSAVQFAAAARRSDGDGSTGTPGPSLARRVRATPGYAPHSCEPVAPPRDWWGLGIVLAEAALGHHPLLLPQLTNPAAPRMEDIDAFLEQHDVPLEEIADAHMALAARGLLARDPRQRWGADQVAAWSRGGRPPAPASLAGPGAPVRVAFYFEDRAITQPAELGEALASSWVGAQRLVTSQALDDLVRWLLPTAHYGAVAQLRATARQTGLHPAFMVCALIRELAPTLPPMFGPARVPLTRTGLVALVRAALEGDDAARTCVAELFDSAALLAWADGASHSDLAELHARWVRVERDTQVLLDAVNREIRTAGSRLVELRHRREPQYRLPDAAREVRLEGAARAVVLAELLGALVSEPFCAELGRRAAAAQTGWSMSGPWFAQLGDVKNVAPRLGYPGGRRARKRRRRWWEI